MNREEKIMRFAYWLDGGVIADIVLDELEEAGGSTSLETMQETWLDSLEHLNESIRSTIRWGINRGL